MFHSTRRHPQHWFLFVITAALAVQHHALGASTAPTDAPKFGAIAPAFVRNIGQADSSARFIAVGGGRPIFFTDQDVRIVDPARSASLWLSFVGGSPQSIDGDSPTGGSVSYLERGRDGKRLPAYRDVVYRRLWPGI